LQIEIQSKQIANGGGWPWSLAIGSQTHADSELINHNFISYALNKIKCCPLLGSYLKTNKTVHFFAAIKKSLILNKQ